MHSATDGGTCSEEKRSPLQPVVVQQALSTVNKELASELEQAKAEYIMRSATQTCTEKIR